VQFVFEILQFGLWMFMAVLFIRFIVDWVQVFARSWTPRGPLLVVLEGVYTVTDPPLRALRRIIPPLRFGGIGWRTEPVPVVPNGHLRSTVAVDVPTGPQY
jgi:YggT family protein